MLEYIHVKNIALIDEIAIEFGRGLNLMTGETGSGKSIVVDSISALTGGRVSSEMIKSGETKAWIEGVFSVVPDVQMRTVIEEAGIELGDEPVTELIVRRELSASGKNRIFLNGTLVTLSLLQQVGPKLAMVHGQGEHAALFEVATHLGLLDAFAGADVELKATAEAYSRWSTARAELFELQTSDAEKLQLLDILRFQIDELRRANLKPGEEVELGEEKLRLNNVEKLSSLSREAFDLLYDDVSSTSTTLDKAIRKIEELGAFDSRFGEYIDGLRTAAAVIQDAAISARDFGSRLEFSPERLGEIETRLAEITRVTRKYGGTVDTALAHLAEAERRLESIETSELRERELRADLAKLATEYLDAALRLSSKRREASGRFEKQIAKNLKAVALDKAKFVVSIDTPADTDAELDEPRFTGRGIDEVEFLFSANPGEEPRPLARVASGGEASRLMLILKTTARGFEKNVTAVFDEVDAGIGGRVAEAVGGKLKSLAADQQVLCVTHQPQVASKADHHFVIEKLVKRNSTAIAVRKLSAEERVEELARMLAGEKITEAARENARELIAAAAG